MQHDLVFETYGFDGNMLMLTIAASSPFASAITQSYTLPGALHELSAVLAAFPRTPGEVYFWRNERAAPHLPATTLTFTDRGEGRIQIEAELEIADSATAQHLCRFYIETTAPVLRHFGQKLAPLQNSVWRSVATLHA